MLLLLYVFSADHFVLDYKLGVSFLGKVDSPSLSSHLRPVALLLGVGPCDIYPMYTGMLTGYIIIQVLIRLPYCWNFKHADFLTYIEDTVS